MLFKRGIYISDYPLLLVVICACSYHQSLENDHSISDLSSHHPSLTTMEKQRRSITGRFWSSRPKFSEKNEPLYLERFHLNNNTPGKTFSCCLFTYSKGPLLVCSVASGACEPMNLVPRPLLLPGAHCLRIPIISLVFREFVK